MQMQTKIKYSIVATVMVVLLLVACNWHDYLRLGVTYGWDNLPTHPAPKGCSWERASFQKSGISFYLPICTETKPLLTYSEDQSGRIMRAGKLASAFTMQVFTKQESQSSLAIMEDWFTKLSPEQQKNCEIQIADVPIEYLPNGTRSDFESPHPTPHKTRYKIDVKPEIVQEITNKFDGVPDSQEYDYLCGKVVGSPFVASTPYFEFDDRSPGKYLFVGSLGNDGSVLIDINSIRF
jgi:hypothetical protein